MKSKPGNYLILNFGVAAGRKCFSLESTAKNIMNFGCPDERGNQPLNQIITESYRNGCTLDTHALTDIDCQKLRDKISCDKVEVSQNAGEYLCNYVFFKALETTLWIK